MPKLNFTARNVGTLKRPETGQLDYWDGIAPGFGLRVSAIGRRTWMVMYRHEGRKRRMTLGTYPALSLADAREKARDKLGEVAKGGDPASAVIASRRAGTFRDLCDLYIEKYAKPNKRSWKEDERIINYDLLPSWGSRKAKDITRGDVNKLLNEKVERGTPIAANRMLAVIRKMYSWAIGSDRVELEVNPCHEVKMPSKERIRSRHLTSDEIKSFWPMVSNGVVEAKIGASSIIALRLILATAQRPGEIIDMSWQELDEDWEDSSKPFWTMPGTRTKNQSEHRVPLSSLSVSLLKDAKALVAASTRSGSNWVFPSPRGDKPIAGALFSHALTRSKHFGLPHFTPHDLRRTAATHMTGPDCKVSRFILERVLNHADQTVTGMHYDLYEYDEEKRLALDTWSVRLSHIIER